jgi:hypothetical protein
MSTSSTTPVIEEVTLNWTDLTGKKTGATALGSNKFYKAQIFDKRRIVQGRVQLWSGGAGGADAGGGV